MMLSRFSAGNAAATAAVLGLAMFASEAEAAARGAVGLDSLTFDKIVDGSRPVLLKIDKQYPYGDQEDAFKEFVKDVAASSLLVAEVGVQDYADKENDDLRERFGADAEDFPVFLLFKKAAAAGAAPIRFEGEGVTTNGLKRFVTAETGIWIGLAGTLEAFDQIATDLTTGSIELAVATQRMRAEHEKLAEGSDAHKAGKIYTIIVDRIAKKHAADDGGEVAAAAHAFVIAEIGRVSRLLKGKLSDAKKATLDTRLNILASFLKLDRADDTAKEEL